MKLPTDWSLASPAQCSRSIEELAQEAILKETGAAVEQVLFDGAIHRFRVDGDTGSEKSGWYILFDKPIPAGAFGNWKQGDRGVKWHASGISVQASSAELEKIWRLVWKQRDEELRMRRKIAEETCNQIWEAAPEAGPDHPYLQKKKVKNHGLRQTGDGRLIMPVYVEDKLKSPQYIDAGGKKQFHSGGEVAQGYFRIPAGERPSSSAKYIVEGYATGASVHEATGCEVWIALNAGNLKKVCSWLRANLPEAELVIVGDNDESGVGQKRAAEAAEAAGARCVIPPERGDANDYAASGKDLRALLSGAQRRHWIIPFSEFQKQPQPIKWLIKGWIQRKGTHMVFGPSGVGKSFAVIDMAASIACPEIEEWHGCKLKHGPVVYLTGEGFLGLRQRFVGWGAHKGVKDIPVYLSSEARDLNTPDGLRDTIEEIRSYDTRPVLIVVDTLNRFMAGDENKAQDTKTMLDACAALAEAFDCAVLLVHHSGVSENAQDRARGSSAWRGAMDIEIQVSGSGGRLTLNQTKNKDAERQKPLELEMLTVDVPGWIDEDGAQVTTCVIETSSAVTVEEEDRLTRTQAFALQTFEKAASTVGILDDEGHFAGLPRKAWRDVFYDMCSSESPGAKRTLFNRAQSELQKIGRIELQDGDMYRLAGFISGITEEAFAMSLRKMADGA